MLDTTSVLKPLARKARAILLRGNEFYCPVCRTGYRKFLPGGVEVRANAICPGCRSLERHRLLLSVLEKLWIDGTLGRGGRMLHVAPEPALAAAFMRDFDYTSIDLDGSRAMQAMDLTALKFADQSFDAIVCNHVLEHIPDDRMAIAELHRVTKVGGWGSLQVPMQGDVTQEDLSITDPQERLRRYGQTDHVRLYGRDFLDRLAAVGFQVMNVPKDDLLDPDLIGRLSVDCETSVILVRRTA